jgi:signal transduction histidine kinase
VSAAVAWLREATPARRVRTRRVAGIALVAAAYYGSAKLGFVFAFSGPVAAIVWLPAGVGVAFLYVGGVALWPGVLIGDLLANDYSTLPWWVALLQTVGNVLEVVLAVVLIRRFVRRGSPLDTVPGVLVLAGAIIAGTALSATIGVASAMLGHVVARGVAGEVWRTWWLGDLSGALVVVPIALAWSAIPVRWNWRSPRTLEAALMIAAVASLSEIGFRSDSALYIVFPALVWSALRFGQRGATVAIAVTVGAAVWHTVHENGPFHFHSITHSVLAAQLFIAVAALSTLCITALVAEREGYADGLRRSRVRIVEAADLERRRLERNLHDGAQHRLTALVYLLRRGAERADESAVLFEEAETEVTRAIDELRELAHGIHPSVLTDLGLANALRSVAARSVQKVELVELPELRVDRTAESTAYYVVTEAVTNAQRHAHASAIRIRVGARHNALRVVVADDGVGGAQFGNGSGLQGLADRVEALGGKFAVWSLPGRGTIVEAIIPAAPAA